MVVGSILAHGNMCHWLKVYCESCDLALPVDRDIKSTNLIIQYTVSTRVDKMELSNSKDQLIYRGSVNRSQP